MSLVQAILVALIYYLANSPWPFGGLGNYATLYRPMVSGLLVGLVLGDPVKGVQIGATINLMYIGAISAGGSMPADMSLAGILGTALAITSGIDANAALAIAVPLGLIGSVVWVIHLSLDSIFVRISDRYVEEGKPEKVWIVNILLSQILLFCLTAVPCFVAAYFGTGVVSSLLETLSGTFLSVLSTIGGMLPAVGIGMMLTAMFKGEAKLFFFLGFVLCAYLGLGTLPIAIIFLLIALIYVGVDGFDVLKSNGKQEFKENLLKKTDLKKVFWNWMYYFQSCYNYERMQGVGFLHAMTPVITRLYGNDKDEKVAAMRRHTEFFNTENATGEVILGLVCAMEEQKKNGAEIDESTFTSIKTGLMGPIAGVGDTLWQAVVIPLLISVFISMAAEGSVIAPILYCIIFVVLYNGFGYWLFNLGYTKGNEAIAQILESGIVDKVVRIANILGCAVMGALVCNYVSLTLKVNLLGIDLQSSFFDALLPGLLPLVLTLGCYSLIKKGKPAYIVMLILAILGLAGGLLGIF